MSRPTPSSPAQAPIKNERLLLLTLAGIQFTHILDFMIMMPLGPQLLRLLNMDTHEFGLLLSSYTFTAAASSLLAASYVDRFDRRKLLLTLYVLFALATLCCGLAPNFTFLLIARALAGAFGGILGAMVQTIVADVVPFERRGQAMGTVMAAFSLSTVAGVPLGLFLATHIPALDWRAPFFFIVLLSAVILALAWRQLPSLTAHIDRPKQGNVLQQIVAVAKEPNHVKAFVFISLLTLAGFTVIPYIALYYTANVGISDAFITVVYLCGGAATFFSSRLIGRLADQHGKLRTFRWLALASLVPVLVTTHLVPVPWWLLLINSTVFFVLVSGRFIPAMAMLTEAAAPPVRGTFMSLVSSVQMMSSGVASLIAGLIIKQTTSGQVAHYNLVGYIAVACGLLSLVVASRLKSASATLARAEPHA
ncbi:MFS transporter [Noviherbaspirillum cavernae]|uniref:MFS transporter n=1 Tax=Noviherbaspirillum cavernae TaxID=2320862 RepID=A0A418WXH0_9BURK|nr:MFS transporter [Noviherbaspirillum cavernae]RJG04948.1 MFS transporter [Noviherbaspirillum cavernae]